MLKAAKALVTGWKAVDPGKVLDYAVRMDNSAVFKRLGYLLELHGLSDGPYLDRLREHLRPGYAKLEPLNPFRGRHCGRWLLRLNLDPQDLVHRRAG